MAKGVTVGSEATVGVDILVEMATVGSVANKRVGIGAKRAAVNSAAPAAVSVVNTLDDDKVAPRLSVVVTAASISSSPDISASTIMSSTTSS